MHNGAIRLVLPSIITPNLGDTYSSGGRETQVRDTFRDAASGKQDYLNGTAVRAATPPNCKPKDLVGIPWMMALALRADGWYLRSDIIWAKPNPMPESVRDRPTRSHEYIFLMSKRERYYYDADAIKEPSKYVDTEIGGTIYKDAKAFDGKHSDKQRGHSRRHAGFNDRWDHMTKAEQGECGRNKRDVWTVATKPYSGAHFATFPPALIEPCVLAGSRAGDVVLDPFFGSGTTGEVSERLGRRWMGIELNDKYSALQKERTQQSGMIFA